MKVDALNGKSRWYLSFLILLVLTPLSWKDSKADSKWALVFLGDRVWAGDIRAVGLGSNMQLLEDSLALQQNPATTINIRKFTFQTSAYFSSDRGSSDDYTETDASFTFSSFIFAVPLIDRLSVGL
ncbi:MAG: hypothetical protein PVF33_11700, partial [Candidatus Latescibacterota bacterium]